MERRTRPAWATLAVAALLVSGCGGGDDGPHKVAERAGFATYEVESAGFSLAVPADWRAYSGEALESADFHRFDAENPDFASTDAGSEDFEFAAIDPSRTGGFPTSVNVLLGAAPGGSSIEDALPDAVRSIGGLPVVPGSFEHGIVSLPGGRALRLAYTTEVTLQGARRLVASRQYGFLVGTKTYLVTFTTPASLAGKYEPVFARSAASFRPDR
jgi:hypothetical protein